MSPAATHMTDGERLRAIRAALAAIQPGHWQRAADDEGEFLEARTEHGELLPIARFHAGATFDEMTFICSAPAMVGFLLSLVDRAIAAQRARGGGSGVRSGARPAGGERERKDFAAEAAMKCAEPAFKAFLEARHGLERPLTDERTAQKLRTVLAITSRRELNEDNAAAARWDALRRDFQAWRKAG